LLTDLIWMGILFGLSYVIERGLGEKALSRAGTAIAGGCWWAYFLLSFGAGPSKAEKMMLGGIVSLTAFAIAWVRRLVVLNRESRTKAVNGTGRGGSYNTGHSVVLSPKRLTLSGRASRVLTSCPVNAPPLELEVPGEWHDFLIPGTGGKLEMQNGTVVTFHVGGSKSAGN
jgi:hypothetical protein